MNPPPEPPTTATRSDATVGRARVEHASRCGRQRGGDHARKSPSVVAFNGADAPRALRGAGNVGHQRPLDGEAEREREGVRHPNLRGVGIGVGSQQRAAALDESVHHGALGGVRRHRGDAAQHERVVRDESSCAPAATASRATASVGSTAKRTCHRAGGVSHGKARRVPVLGERGRIAARPMRRRRQPWSCDLPRLLPG